MKTIFKKIYIHPLTYLIILISLITGLIKPIITLLFIIIIHELGHILSSMLFKWKIDRIVILPFGGITIFNELINRPLYQEFIILVSGPLFQFINYLIFNNINNYFNSINYGLFLFNFLPIYPLDGYKFWVILFSTYLPYKIVLYLMVFISILFIIKNFKLNFIIILVLFFLLVGLIKHIKEIKYIYLKFLLERNNHKFKFKKTKHINNINHFYKDKYHIINNIKEEDYLKNKFNLF